MMELEKFFSECMIIAFKAMVGGVLWAVLAVTFLVGVAVLTGAIERRRN